MPLTSKIRKSSSKTKAQGKKKTTFASFQAADAQNDVQMKIGRLKKNNNGVQAALPSASKNGKNSCQMRFNDKKTPKNPLLSPPSRRYYLREFKHFTAKELLLEPSTPPLAEFGFVERTCRGRMCSPPKRFQRREKKEDFFIRFDKRELA